MTEETIKYNQTKNLNDQYAIIHAKTIGKGSYQRIWPSLRLELRQSCIKNPGKVKILAKNISGKLTKMNIEDFPMELTYFHLLKY